MWSDSDSATFLTLLDSLLNYLGHSGDEVGRRVALRHNHIETFVQKCLQVGASLLFRCFCGFNREVAIDKQVDRISVNFFDLTLNNYGPDHIEVLKLAWIVHDKEVRRFFVIIFILIIRLLVPRLIP